MKIKKYAKNFSIIPLPTLQLLVGAGVIHNPLTREDFISLDLLESLWGDEDMIFAQMEEMSASERQQIFNKFDKLQEMDDGHQELCSNQQNPHKNIESGSAEGSCPRNSH